MLYGFVFCLFLTLTIEYDVLECMQPIAPSILEFTYTSNGSIDTTTKAHLCHDENLLHIYWWSYDDQIIANYENCNDPLYEQDVVQVFLATQSSYPYHYFQLQVSPKEALFFADITNPNQTCYKLETLYYPCTIEYKAKVTSNGWEASIKIPLQTVGRGKKPSLLKGNLFRIDKSSTEPTRYLSMIPTYSIPPCFHKPLRFIDMNLS